MLAVKNDRCNFFLKKKVLNILNDMQHLPTHKCPFFMLKMFGIEKKKIPENPLDFPLHQSEAVILWTQDINIFLFKMDKCSENILNLEKIGF